MRGLDAIESEGTRQQGKDSKTREEKKEHETAKDQMKCTHKARRTNTEREGEGEGGREREEKGRKCNALRKISKTEKEKRKMAKETCQLLLRQG